MKLYVCYGAFPTGPKKHPCREALLALQAAGHEPEVVRAYGLGPLPDGPFNLTPARRRVKALTGSTMVPALELEDGTAIGGSQAVIAWAAAHPAPAAAAV